MRQIFVGFEAFLAVTRKIAFFRDGVPCGFIINRHFRGMYLASIFIVEEKQARKIPAGGYYMILAARVWSL
jgi:hypothetical protein